VTDAPKSIYTGIDTSSAQKLGTDAGYISAFFGNVAKFEALPAGSLQKLARLLNEWAEADHRRTRSRTEQAFVSTIVAERIIKVARHVCETGDIGLIHGLAGIGKSTTLVELQKLVPASLYILLTTDCTRRSGFLRALRDAVWQTRSPSRATLADIIERLKMSDRLLLLDNADVLDPACYQVIMDLHDVAGVPILLAGTYKLLTKLTHDADPLRGQMSSRSRCRARPHPDARGVGCKNRRGRRAGRGMTQRPERCGRW